MGFLATVIACLCLPVYIPLAMMSLRQLGRGEVILTRWSFLNIRVTHLKGFNALLYSGMQLLGALIVIGALLAGVSQGSPGTSVLGILLGWAVGVGGASVARSLQGENVVDLRSPGGDSVQQTTVFSDGSTFYVRTQRQTPDSASEGEETTYTIGEDDTRQQPSQLPKRSEPSPYQPDIEDADFRDVLSDDDGDSD